MDCLDKILPSGTPAHHRTDTNEGSRRSSSRCHSHTRCSHHEHRNRSRFRHSRSRPSNHSYRSSSHQDPCRSHSRSFHRSSHCNFSHDRSSSPTTTVAILPSTDPHLTGTLPEMTADLNIGPGNIITNQTEDLHPLHRHHLGNTRTKDTSKS